METLLEFLTSLHQPDKLIELIRSGGYLVLATIVFAETGLFIGFFLPGDSLLFLAGLCAAQGFFEVNFLMVLLSLMAIIGDALGYWIGHRTGMVLYERKDTFWFKTQYQSSQPQIRLHVSFGGNSLRGMDWVLSAV